MTKINCPECKNSHEFNLTTKASVIVCADHGERVPAEGMMKCHKCKEPFSYGLSVVIIGKTKKLTFTM